MSAVLRGFANEFTNAGVVVVPSFGVASTLYDTHVVHEALDAAIADVV